MANFDTIKTAIDANIKTNGTQEITGSKMNSILKQMVGATDEQLTELESKSGYGKLEVGYYIHYENGKLVTFGGLQYVEKAVTKGEVVTYKSFMSQPDARGLAFYGVGGDYITGYQAIATDQTIIVPENAVLCRASVSKESDLVIFGYNEAIAFINDYFENNKLLISKSFVPSAEGVFSDLNTFPINTMYVVTTTSIGTSILNKPSKDVNFHVYTFCPIDAGNVRFQIFISTHGIIYGRAMWGESWSEWEEMTNRKFFETSFINDFYINYQNGIIAPFGGFAYVECAVSKGMVITYKSFLSQPDLRGLAFYGVGGDYITGYQAITTDQTIIVPDGAVLCRASVTDKNDIFIYGYNDAISAIAKDAIQTKISVGAELQDKYIAYESGVLAEFGGLKHLEIPVSYGLKLSYYYVVARLDSRGLAFYDKNGTFILGYQTLTTPQTILVPKGAVLCRATATDKSDVSLSEYNVAISNLYNQDERYSANILGAFEKIICIGDSLTFSQVYTSDTRSRQAYQTYPKVLSKLTGTPTEGYARAGASAMSCYEEFASQITEKVNNALAIVYLGTNLGLTNSIDSDIQGEDANSWAENQLGYYCRFVDKLIKLGYKVLLLRIWATSGTGGSNLENTTAAISSVAERLNVAVMDTPLNQKIEYHYYPDKSGSNGVHYNDLGYAWFADALMQDIGKLDETMISRLLVQ